MRISYPSSLCDQCNPLAPLVARFVKNPFPARPAQHGQLGATSSSTSVPTVPQAAQTPSRDAEISSWGYIILCIPKSRTPGVTLGCPQVLSARGSRQVHSPQGGAHPSHPERLLQNDLFDLTKSLVLFRAHRSSFRVAGREG